MGNYGNTLYNHASLPNAAHPDCTNATQQKGDFATRSEHRGGVQVVRCDTGVSFIEDAIDLNAWKALGTWRGGESYNE
ncbi:MAG: DUF1559 domain-containing protein [Pirellulales bacterium]